MISSAAVVAAIVVVAYVVSGSVRRAHDHLVEHFDRQTKRLERLVMSATQDAVNAVVAQLSKAKGEIVAKIADVQEQLDAAGVPVDEVDLSALTVAAQALDDIVPDVPEVVGDDVPDDAEVDAEVVVVPDPEVVVEVPDAEVVVEPSFDA